MDPKLAALAEVQDGIIRLRDPAAHGLDRHQLRTALRAGDLIVLSDRVARVAGAPDTPRSRARAAVLDNGARAALALWSAAACFKLPGFDLEPSHVLTDRPGHHKPQPSDLAVVHYTRRLPDEHITEVDGLRVTTPVRTIFDLAPHLHPRRVEQLVDRAWARNLLTKRLLEATLRQLQGRGRAGITLMRELIDARGDDYRPNDSNLEDRFEQIMREEGITTLRRQVDLGDDRDWIGRADFHDQELPFVVLVQSSLHHRSLVDARKDAAQIAAWRAAGLEVLEVWDRDIFHHRRQVVRDVVDARKRAGARARARTKS